MHNKRPSAFRRLLSWCRRHPIATVAVVVLLVVVGACSNAAAASQTNQSPTAQTTITATPTAIPTKQPTHAATPKPTAKPSPTPHSTVYVQPTSTPQTTPKPTQPSCQAIDNNPWCYDFTQGNLIYHPSSNFCDYFNCIASFWNGSGFVNECYDGTYSLSGGHQGDCSHHGGEWRPLYSH